ncbi:hypothetical protein [Anaeromyxobacter diazotrophicus]|uniref:RsbT co-antagonist protein RsbRD N-terminal domain-containing protein n=1 Tax=Anaeromyxobacter diazotrophicus TaxID=2590199 RepID=A0A7I9VJ09_9BACT|nr:hypothetical protein [Anaeromyxobacter diazotrophicus]GEJ56355.1 hypothetical protein AMYX_10960 [Anaeromyxobacter diazotrophicus]
MSATGMGLLLEEHRTEIGTTWRQAVERELAVREPALAFAVAPLLREMALALGGDAEARRSREAWTRCAVLVRSSAAPAQLAREFKLLHRCLWQALKTRGAPISQGERLAADEWLDEALAEALERLERVRLRAASFEQHGPVVIPPIARQTRAAVPPRPTPPPLPRRATARPAPAAPEPILELEPIDPS